MELSSRRGPDLEAINSTVLLTDRLRLRPMHPDAAPDLFRLLEGPARRLITDTLLWDGPDTVDDIAAFGHAGLTSPFRESGHHWTIHDLDGRISGSVDQALGAIGLTTLAHPARCDIGYWLGHPFWGQGLMSEAVEAIVDHAFATMAMVKVDAFVFLSNVASARLLERVGFTKEGLQRAAYLKRGKPMDVWAYGMTAEDWHERRLGA